MGSKINPKIGLTMFPTCEAIPKPPRVNSKLIDSENAFYCRLTPVAFISGKWWCHMHIKQARSLAGKNKPCA